ncbi:MAG: hypothetical protein GKR98_17540 [Boseongicola sp.]|nr:MAG: hypothetical protein GKR98_17540 [Boseongicola sp.]
MTDQNTAPQAPLTDLLDDYTTVPVPFGINTTGWQVAAIICAIGITLPAMVFGAFLSAEYGFATANLDFWIGCGMVAVLGALTAVIGSRSRLSTYMILQFPFGQKGARLVNLLMAVILLGWFAVTIEEFGIAVAAALDNMLGVSVSVWVCVLLGSIAMTATTIFGFSAVEKFSRYSVPLLALFLFYVAFAASGGGEGSNAIDFAFNQTDGSLVAVLTGAIGMTVLTAVLMPDFSRYCPNDKQAIIGALVGIGITFPAVLTLVTIPATRTGEADIMAIMAAMGVVFVALFVLIFATWSTNITNLYSSTLTISTFVPKLPSWQVTVIGSVIATVAALLGITAYFINFLILIGVAATPLAGIYVVDYFLVRKSGYQVEDLEQRPAIGIPALAAWVIGTVTGYMTEQGMFSLSGLSAVDALFTTSVAYFIIAKAMKTEG